MESLLTGGLMDWLGAHQQWLGLAIFLIALLESLAIAGLLVPGIVLLLATTAMAGSSGMPLSTVLAAAFAGAVIGDLMSFALGRLFHQDIKRLRLFKRHPQWIQRGEAFFQRHGMLSILLGRFIGPIRPIIPMVAGMFDMPTGRFVAINLLSAIAWAPAYVLPGFLAGQATKWPVPEHFWLQAFGLLSASALLLTALILILRLQTRWSSLVAAMLCLCALAGMNLLEGHLQVVALTFTQWLQAHQWPFVLALLPLASPVFPVVVLLLALVSLLQAKQLRLMSMPLCACLMTSLTGLSVGLEMITLSASIAVSLNISLLVLINRGFDFWTRVGWMTAAIPLAGLIIILLAKLGTPLITLLNLGLVSITAALLSVWMVERAFALPTLTNSLRTSLLLLPLLAWSSLHLF